MNEIKIPCVAVGTKTEELIRDAIEVKRENNAIERRFIRQIFSDASQLKRGANKFNASLCKSILEYGASEHFFKPWTPSTEVLLEIFNRAYKIATIAINMEVPLDYYTDFRDGATIWEELDPETEAIVEAIVGEEGDGLQRNLPALYATFAMVHAIVDREKDKSEFIEDFLDKMRTDEDVNEAMDFFLPADKQGVVTLKNDSIVDREKDKSEFIEDFLDKMRTDEDVNEAMDFFLPVDKQGVVTLKNDSVSDAGSKKKEKFRKLIYNKEKRNVIIKTLHELIDPQPSKIEIVLILKAAIAAGIFVSKPKYEITKAEFPDIGGVSGYNHNFAKEPNSEEEKRVEKYASILGKLL